MGNGRNNRGGPGTARRVSLCGVFALLALCVSAAPVGAVVIRTGDGTGTASAPADDPGWLNVGKLGVATGVYLGSRWVLTLNHVGAGNIDLNGSTYGSTGAQLRLKNLTGGFTEFTDLLLFRIDVAPPGLPDLNISSFAPPAGSGSSGADLVMIGYGRTRDIDDTYWNVDMTTTPWHWTVLPSSVGAEAHGYNALSSKVKRWGENDLKSKIPKLPTTQGDVKALETVFDETGGHMYEAQAVGGDSGGAVFYKNSGNWELAGLMGWVNFPPSLQDEDVNAPAGTRPLFGSLTYAADLSEYKSQITPLVNPEPGDMNADGVVNVDDVPWFLTALTDPDAYLSEFFFVDSFADIVRYGDFDDNGIFDLGDLGLFNSMISGSTFAAAQAVPEPSAFSLFVVGVLSLGYLVRRRSSDCIFRVCFTTLGTSRSLLAQLPLRFKESRQYLAARFQ